MLINLHISPIWILCNNAKKYQVFASYRITARLEDVRDVSFSSTLGMENTP